MPLQILPIEWFFKCATENILEHCKIFHPENMGPHPIHTFGHGMMSHVVHSTGFSGMVNRCHLSVPSYNKFIASQGNNFYALATTIWVLTEREKLESNSKNAGSVKNIILEALSKNVEFWIQNLLHTISCIHTFGHGAACHIV